MLLVATQSGSEGDTARLLASLGISSWVPQVGVYRRPKGRRSRILRYETAFPGYLLAESWPVDGLRNARPVKIGGRTVTLSAATIAQIQDITDTPPETQKRSMPGFVPGDRVRINDGPASGLNGHVILVERRGQSVVIDTGERQLTVDAGHIVKVNEGNTPARLHDSGG